MFIYYLFTMFIYLFSDLVVIIFVPIDSFNVSNVSLVVRSSIFCLFTGIHSCTYLRRLSSLVVDVRY